VAARGGRREGTAGKSYTNRTDLLVQRAPQTGLQTAAAGGLPPVAPAAAPPAMITPDQVPRLDDPTARPLEPVTHGLAYGPGGGPEAVGPIPVNPTVASVQAAYLANPTPELRRALMFMTTSPNGGL